MTHPARCLPLAIALALIVVLWPSPAAALDHCGQVSSNETWARNDSPHVICAEGVSVRNSRLTIEPGATVRFLAGANLVVEPGSRLEAVGTPEAAITFFGATNQSEPGFWGQIRFDQGALDSRLQVARIVGGGKDGVPMVDVRGARVEMASLLFRQSGGAPLAFDADSLGPSLDAIGQVTRKEDRCPQMAMSDVGERVILVYGHDEADVTMDATWHDFCTPYLVATPHDVESEDLTLTVAGTQLPTLTLGPGVILQFEGDSGLLAGLDGDRPGGLFLNGSPIDQTVLTSVSQEPGSWNGIDLSPFVSFDNSLFNARVEYGGRGDRPMIRVLDPAASAIGLTMRHALGYPLAVTSPAVGTMVTGLEAGEGEDEQPAIAENGVDRMLVWAADVEVDVASGTIWSDIGVPYEIDGDVVVAGAGETITFKIESGTHLAFVQGARMQIGHPEHGAATLRAETQGGKPALLTGLAGEPGSWRGLVIDDAAVEVVLDGVVVEHGGAEGPMVQWGATPGVILNSTFRGAMGYPVSVPMAYASVVMSDELLLDLGARNTLEANGVDRFLVRVEEQLFRRVTTWADPGAPVELDDDLVVAGASVPLLELHGGLRLVLREGKRFQIGGDAASRAAVRLRPSDAGPAVAITAADPAAGHAGVVLHQASTLESDGSALAVSGAVASVPNLRVTGERARAILSGLEVTGREGQGIGVQVEEGGSAQITAPRLTGLRVGALSASGGRLVLERGWIHGNSEYGVRNDDPALCQTASRIWWGAPDGPLDESDAEDGCVGAAHDGGGDRVSDDVNWVGYAVDQELNTGGGFVPVASIFLPRATR